MVSHYKLSRIIFTLLCLVSVSDIGALVKTIRTEKEFNESVAAKGSRALVQFSADWCNVCNSIKMRFEEVSESPEFKDIAFARVDIDQFSALSKRYDVVGVPTFVYLEDGVKKMQSVGIHDLVRFKDELAKDIKTNFDISEVSIESPDAKDEPELTATPQSDVTPEEGVTQIRHMEEKPEETALGTILPVEKAEEKAKEAEGLVGQLIAYLKALMTKIWDVIMWLPRKVMAMIGMR